MALSNPNLLHLKPPDVGTNVFHVTGYQNRLGDRVLFCFARNVTDAVWSRRGLVSSHSTCC